LEHLSNIELYYASPSSFKENLIKIESDEKKHILKVMRHSNEDEIFITDGKGKIFKSVIVSTEPDLILNIEEEFLYEKKFPNYFFCIPRLKSNERFEFTLEKCTELGVTNFIIFDSDRSVAKGEKIERWEKILLAAMKQSLQSYLPVIKYFSLKEISSFEGNKILFDQNAEEDFGKNILNNEKDQYLIFGPEGGLTDREKKLFEPASFVRLAANRLRTETAVIKAASML
jgi:16S rRNA (uracil1498-N3)-methyltransferase